MVIGQPSAQTYLASGLDADLPVVDAHHHIWDLQRNYHPWLRDEPLPAFRYGDSRPLRQNYLPSDYRADTAGLNIVATVYMEAEHDPADLLRETQWVHDIAERDGLPQAMAAAAFLIARMRLRSFVRRRAMRGFAAFVTNPEALPPPGLSCRASDCRLDALSALARGLPTSSGERTAL